MCVGAKCTPFHVRLDATVSPIVSVVSLDDASDEDSLPFTMPTFALPWVR